MIVVETAQPAFPGVGTDLTSAFPIAAHGQTQPTFDLGRDLLTPTIIKEMTGRDAVLLDASKADFSARLRQELEQATLVGGESLSQDFIDFSHSALTSVSLYAGTVPYDLRKGIIIYNSELFSSINTASGLSGFILGYPNALAVQESEILNFPTLLMNMAILTEVSHGKLNKSYGLDEIYTDPDSFDSKVWLSDPKNATNPIFLIYRENTTEDEAAYIAMQIQRTGNEARHEIDGEVDAINWTKQWAQEHGRQDLMNAANDYIAIRFMMGMIPSIMRNAALINFNNQAISEGDYQNTQNYYGADPLEDLVAGFGSILQIKGIKTTSLTDVLAIDHAQTRAAAILNFYLSKSVDFNAGEIYNPSLATMHNLIVFINESGTLPNLEDSPYDELRDLSTVQEQQVMDVLTSFGIALERIIPGYVEPILLTKYGRDTWGINPTNAAQTWDFSGSTAPTVKTPAITHDYGMTGPH